MTNPKNYDFLIVGGGLAGVTLALQLQLAGKSVLLLDSKDKNISSHIAAGLYNPITGRKMVKTWMADELFPFLENFYRRIESLTNSTFLYPKSIYRPFLDTEEQNEWMGKSADVTYKDFIANVHTSSMHNDIADKFGGLELRNSGYLNIPAYLQAGLDYLKANDAFLKEKFDYDQLTLQKESLKYSSYSASKIIFCEGVGLTGNPFFNWLPLRPLKGEILKLKGEFDFKHILNRGIFVLPLEKNIVKVGATYDHHDASLKVTAKAKEELLDKLGRLVYRPFEVIDQMAGLRPATKDRRPFVGIHPELETIGVFNGLGTKGVSLAPYWADHLVRYLTTGKKLDDAVNISRYFSLYSE